MTDALASLAVLTLYLVLKGASDTRMIEKLLWMIEQWMLETKSAGDVNQYS